MKEQFGNITLYNADCMDILRELPDKQFDLAIVDPPYFDGPNKLGYYGTSKSSKGVKRPFYKAKHWTVPGNDYFEELMRVSKHQIIWGCNYYQFPFGSGRINRSLSPGAAERPTLALSAKMGLLPTPTVNDATNSSLPASQVKHKSGLPRMAMQSDEYRTGTTSRLNPLYVAEMMGFPASWLVSPFLRGAGNPSKPTATP